MEKHVKLLVKMGLLLDKYHVMMHFMRLLHLLYLLYPLSSLVVMH
jgi:hypothetical protein